MCVDRRRETCKHVTREEASGVVVVDPSSRPLILVAATKRNPATFDLFMTCLQERGLACTDVSSHVKATTPRCLAYGYRDIIQVLQIHT